MVTAAQREQHNLAGRPRPELGELRARLAALLPAIAARGGDGERPPRPGRNIAALSDMGYFDMVKPARFGGYEHDFDVMVELNIELAKACASTAWTGLCRDAVAPRHRGLERVDRRERPRSFQTGQRAWRDVNALARHVGLNWEAIGTMYGQMALGLTPQGQY